MKYIDAEKLIAEIERRIDSWSVRGKNSPVGQGKDTCVSRVTELSDLLSFITSFQQEYPKMDIPSAGSGAMGTTPPKFKLDVKQDLPVGLEKEIQEYLEKLGGGHGGFVDNLIDDDLTGLALHFYGLGLNARKED